MEVREEAMLFDGYLLNLRFSGLITPVLKNADQEDIYTLSKSWRVGCCNIFKYLLPYLWQGFGEASIVEEAKSG